MKLELNHYELALIVSVFLLALVVVAQAIFNLTCGCPVSVVS